MIGIDNMVGPRPALVPRDVRRLLNMKAGGWRTSEIAYALDISYRTVQRYHTGQVVSVVVGEWNLTFLVRPGQPPALLERARVTA